MSNVIAGMVRGQYPHLEEHIAQKKAIYERYKEGLKDLPISMNPYTAHHRKDLHVLRDPPVELKDIRRSDRDIFIAGL